MVLDGVAVDDIPQKYCGVDTLVDLQVQAGGCQVAFNNDTLSERLVCSRIWCAKGELAYLRITMKASKHRNNILSAKWHKKRYTSESPRLVGASTRAAHRAYTKN